MKAIFAKSLLIVSLLTFGSFVAPTDTFIQSPVAKVTSQAMLPKVEAAEVAPDFAFTDLATGKVLKLSDLRDKPVYLNFWATWCPPCVRELPHIQTKYEQYKDRMHFVAISVDRDQEAPAQYILRKGYTFLSGYGNEQEISNLYQIEAIPLSLIIGTDGNIIAKTVGSMDEADLEKFLQKGL